MDIALKQLKIHQLLIISVLLFVPVSLSADSAEYEIKAAFIYNFSKFVEWTDQTSINQSDNLPLCILGEDPFGEAIDKLEGKKVQGSALHIKRIASIDEYSGCRILFISKSEKNELSTLLDTLDLNKNILSISDINGFANSGGVIELVLSDNKIRFIVNIDTVNRSNLNLSSKILRLANVVGGN